MPIFRPDFHATRVDSNSQARKTSHLMPSSTWAFASPAPSSISPRRDPKANNHSIMPSLQQALFGRRFPTKPERLVKQLKSGPLPDLSTRPSTPGGLEVTSRRSATTTTLLPRFTLWCPDSLVSGFSGEYNCMVAQSAAKLHHGHHSLFVERHHHLATHLRVVVNLCTAVQLLKATISR